MTADRVRTYGANEEVTDLLRSSLRSGDALLLKGSRVEKMETILQGLLADAVAR